MGNGTSRHALNRFEQIIGSALPAESSEVGAVPMPPADTDEQFALERVGDWQTYLELLGAHAHRRAPAGCRAGLPDSAPGALRHGLFVGMKRRASASVFILKLHAPSRRRPPRTAAPPADGTRTHTTCSRTHPRTIRVAAILFFVVSLSQVVVVLNSRSPARLYLTRRYNFFFAAD